MLATTEIIRETGQLDRLAERLPQWRERPLYRAPLAGCTAADWDCFQRLPILTKRELRADFPHNFFNEAQALESLLAKNLVEREHTSGTSEERLPVIFPRGKA